MTIGRRTVESFPEVEFVEGGRKYKATDTRYELYVSALRFAENMIYFKRGWVDAIILEKRFDDGTLMHSVYLARKDDTKLSMGEASKIGYAINSVDRIHRINCMYDAGQRGIRDMSLFSSKFVVQPENTKTTSKDISPDHDIIGFDHPRTDVSIVDTEAGKAIRTGGNTVIDRGPLAAMAVDVLDKNFTGDEVRRMNLYFEGSEPMLADVAGTCSYYKAVGEEVSTIAVPREHVSEDVLTHEVVHALRSVDGRRVHDRDMDEIETDYETKLRIRNPSILGGYYQYIPGVRDADGKLIHQKVYDAIADDRIMATGATDRPAKGRRLTHDIIPNTLLNSRIATAQITHRKRPAAAPAGSYQMIAEDIDNYFQIKLPNKNTVEYHISFTRTRPPLKEIKKHLKEKFGKNIEAWEWKDGKRVRLISRSKKRTTTKKRTTKKATTRKTPSKRRIPMTKTPNQYLKGIPPIPGGFL